VDSWESGQVIELDGLDHPVGQRQKQELHLLAQLELSEGKSTCFVSYQEANHVLKIAQ
jgi:hypothetical protein